MPSTPTALDVAECPRRSGRTRTEVVADFPSVQDSGQRSRQAAAQYLDATFDSPAAAAAHWEVDRQHVNYYVRKLVAAGVPRSEKSCASETASRCASPDATESACPYNAWCAAWLKAHALGEQGFGRRRVAAQVREEFGIKFSSSSAQRAMQSGGELPGRKGRELCLPREVELKLEDLCLCLRELHLPVFRFMVLNYVNVLIQGTIYAEDIKDKEVRRAWYYRWLLRCARPRTATKWVHRGSMLSRRPIQMRRAVMRVTRRTSEPNLVARDGGMRISCSIFSQAVQLKNTWQNTCVTESCSVAH